MPQIRYLQALNQALHEEMARDENVFVLGEDVRPNMRGETTGLTDRFGLNRVIDTPISEAGFVGFATGAAMAGMRPIVEFQISALVYVSFDQLVNQAAKLPFMLGGQVKVPVTYLVMGSGARNAMAGQHSDNPYPFLIHAGIKTVCPSTPYDMKGLAISAIREDDPVAIFAPAAALPIRGEVPEEPYTVPLGVGDVKREGSDVTVVAVGHLVHDALKVADELAGEGISVEVWDPRTLLPLDREGLSASVRKTGRVVIYDDSNLSCGYGAELAAVIAEHCFDALKAPVKRISRAAIPIPFSPPLEKASLASPEHLASAIRAITGARMAATA